MNFYTGKTVAVTGCSGYLGSALVLGLSELPVKIIRVSQKDLLPIIGIETIKAVDYASKDLWLELFCKADVIFHLAGPTSLYEAANDPVGSISSTLLPVVKMIEAAMLIGHRRRVVFASTATVYGLTDVFPVSESTPVKPVTNYDLHKLFVEMQLALATERGILEAVSLRLSNVYGPSSMQSSGAGRGVLNKVTQLALQGKKIPLYGGGGYLRDYVYIQDVVRAFMVTGMESGVVGKALNVASGTGIRVADVFKLVAERVESAVGGKVDVENAPWPDATDPIELRNFVASTIEIQRATDWRPKISLEEGLDRLIEHLMHEYNSNEPSF